MQKTRQKRIRAQSNFFALIRILLLQEATIYQNPSRLSCFHGLHDTLYLCIFAEVTERWPECFIIALPE